MLPGVTFVAWVPGMVLVLEPPPVAFHHLERAAWNLLSLSLAPILPVVISSEVMNDSRPVRHVDTVQAGFHCLGWKSLMLRQRRVDG